MKAFIAVIIIFFLIISLVIANSLYVTNIFSKISDLSNDLINDAPNADTVEEILSVWQKSQSLLSLSIEADELERMNDLIESLHTACLTNNSYDIKKYCRLVSELSQELMSYERISFDSIF